MQFLAGDIGRLDVLGEGESGYLPVYTARGELRRSLYNRFENTVIVKSAADLANIDSTKNYMIDGVIDMGTTSIIVPEGGLNISGLNGARDTAQLISSAPNYTMFVSPNSSYSGNVLMEGLTVSVTGSGSRVFNLDNDGNFSGVDILGVNFTDCTSLGQLTDYRQILFDTIGFISIDDGLTFNGTWSGIACLVSVVVNFPAATLFKAGTGFTVTSVRSDINFLSANASAVLFDFAPSNVTLNDGMSLTGVRTTATNPLPNFPASSSKSAFSRCLGFKNTYRGGQFTFTSEVATTFTGASTPAKIAGTTTYSALSHFTGANNNEFVYTATNPREVLLMANFSISGTVNRQIDAFFRFYDASAGAYVDDFNLRPKFLYTMNGGGSGTSAEGITVSGYATVENGDRIELWGENVTDSSSITALLGGFVTVTERAS